MDAKMKEKDLAEMGMTVAQTENFYYEIYRRD